MKRLLLCPLFLVFLGALSAPATCGDRDPDLAVLLEGVHRIALPGIPGTVCVFGPDAFPVVAAPSDSGPAVLVGAARLGRGRAVLFGHDYVGDAMAVGDTARLVANVVRWAAGGSEAVRVGVRGRPRAIERLREAGFDVRGLNGSDWTRTLAEVDVAVLRLAGLDEEEVEVVGRRLRAGMGVVGGMPGWGWTQLNPGRDLATENPGNRLLAPAGLVWGGGTIRKPRSGSLEVRDSPPPLTHAGTALAMLVRGERSGAALPAEQRMVAVDTLSRAIREVPRADVLLRPRLADLRRGRRGSRTVPTAERPVTVGDGLARVLLTFELEEARHVPPGEVEAHPAARIFPGAVPGEAPRTTSRVTIDTNVPRWHGTGLYAAPGEVVTILVPESATAARLSVQIGAHTDGLWNKPTWRRAPAVTRRFDVTAVRTEAASAFGGPLYVVVPPDCGLGGIEVQLDGAVPAPRYVLGETTADAWREDLRQRPAPWAELETSKVVLTLPSEVVRDLEDPEPLMRWWDRVLDACADLAARPRERAYPERYVADEQISAGYMHAGYPIMTHLDAAPRFVDLETLSRKGDWGMFHEMGHNHQHPDWTFAGTTEVTCNLFSLYLMETLCEAGGGHGAMSAQNVARNRALYRAQGSQFETWKAKPFTALILYAELQEAFGWDAYKKVFAEYRGLSPDERPKTDAEKRDQFLVRMSKTVGRNLAPFFDSWGVPTSKRARAAVSHLPAWVP